MKIYFSVQVRETALPVQINIALGQLDGYKTTNVVSHSHFNVSCKNLKEKTNKKYQKEGKGQIKKP